MNKTKINKWGNSFGIRIPKNVINSLKMEVSQELVFTVEDGQIVLTPLNDKPTLDQLLKKVTKENRPSELYYDKPMGREVW